MKGPRPGRTRNARRPSCRSARHAARRCPPGRPCDFAGCVSPHWREVQLTTTTNDNVDALRFYQRRGFRLAELRPGAVDRSRQEKPQIPRVGDYGIPLHDEIDLTLRV